jgi:hypothetical protein
MAEKLHIPDVIEPDEKLPKDLVALRRFARFMDEAFEIPGTRMRVGFDALVGLIPGIGDVIGAVLSSWILVGGLRHRVGPVVIARMIGNIVIDMLFGAVPVAGDVFDFLYEENVKNMRLLEKHRNRHKPPRSYASIAVVAIILILFVAGLAVTLVAGIITLVLWLIGQRPGM